MTNHKTEVMKAKELSSNRIVLQLLGIDKKWVRSPKGEWVDKKSVKKKKKEISIEIEDDVTTKSWWQFWKK